VRPVFEPAWTRAAAAVREGLPVALSLLLVVLYGRAGVFALQWGSTPAEVGCFNVAWMLAQPLGFLASSLAVALFPAVARAGRDRAALAVSLRAANRYQWMLSLPLAAGLSLVAPAVVALLFPGREGFANAVPALRVVALALPFVFLNLQSRYLLAACDAAGAYLRAVAIGLAVVVAGCAGLVREHGALGAAWTFVVAEAAVFAVTQFALARRCDPAGLFAEALRPAVAALAMVAAAAPLSHLPLALVVAVGAVVYAVVLAAVGGWRRRESQLLLAVVRSFQPLRRAPDVRPGRPS
jgi:O-antigen/teichoic acid export membrane protein